MIENPKIELTRKQLDEGILTDKCNQVIVEMTYSSDGATTRSGIVYGFNRSVNYAEGSDSHPANLQEVWGIVYKCPPKLYYNENDPNSMEWDTDMELQESDVVFFSLIESANSHEVLCEGKTYKILPYADCYVAKRKEVELWKLGGNFEGGLREVIKVIPLNGYVLCQTVNLPKLSALDVTSEDKIDKTRAIVRYVGTCNRSYKVKSYIDHQDLQPGDEVLLERNTVHLPLERKSYSATFNGDELYILIPRRKIAMVIKRKSNE
jgi:hypothetical protein